MSSAREGCPSCLYESIQIAIYVNVFSFKGSIVWYSIVFHRNAGGVSDAEGLLFSN